MITPRRTRLEHGTLQLQKYHNIQKGEREREMKKSPIKRRTLNIKLKGVNQTICMVFSLICVFYPHFMINDDWISHNHKEVTISVIPVLAVYLNIIIKLLMNDCNSKVES